MGTRAPSTAFAMIGIAYFDAVRSRAARSSFIGARSDAWPEVASRQMADITCVRCQATVSPMLIDYLEEGAVCRTCLIAADSNPEAIARGERALMRSMGRRSVAIGIFMLAIGVAILALGASGGGSIMLLPTGLLIGGIVELVRGASKLSG